MLPFRHRPARAKLKERAIAPRSPLGPTFPWPRLAIDRRRQIPHAPPLMPMNTQGLEFLTPEESAKVDAALLSPPEKFLTRITLSSLKLLRYIADEEGVPIESLSQDQVITWFERDAKRKREQGIDATVLKWDV